MGALPATIRTERFFIQVFLQLRESDSYAPPLPKPRRVYRKCEWFRPFPFQGSVKVLEVAGRHRPALIPPFAKKFFRGVAASVSRGVSGHGDRVPWLHHE